ncbi:hypothetical protein [Cognataquiflexum aquatile]|uniref:hypothetical protein n=1 Tax=Cognataquiflexum aquatile TaxID=2249427 RepID=UPI000DEAC2A6|nr:hypothetical protein [Cognataquiflexum aquatile]
MKILKIIIVITSVLGLYFIQDQIFAGSMWNLSRLEVFAGFIIIGLYLFYLYLIYIYNKKFGNSFLKKINELQKEIEVLEKKLEIIKLRIEIKKEQND